MPDSEVAEALRVLRRNGINYLGLADFVKWIDKEYRYVNSGNSSFSFWCKFCDGELNNTVYKNALSNYHKKNLVKMPNPLDYVSHLADCKFQVALKTANEFLGS